MLFFYSPRVHHGVGVLESVPGRLEDPLWSHSENDLEAAAEIEACLLSEKPRRPERECAALT